MNKLVAPEVDFYVKESSKYYNSAKELFDSYPELSDKYAQLIYDFCSNEEYTKFEMLLSAIHLGTMNIIYGDNVKHVNRVYYTFNEFEEIFSKNIMYWADRLQFEKCKKVEEVFDLLTKEIETRKTS